MVRLTPGHPSLRLNSINPLDPADLTDFDRRLSLVAPRFEAAGRKAVFRLSPLAPAALARHLGRSGWSAGKETLVMRADLHAMDLDSVMAQIPMRDAARFLDAATRVRDHAPPIMKGLEKVLSAIRPETGLFLLEDEGRPLSSLICVRDGSFAGLLEVATHVSARGRGYARRMVLAALKWARLRGASVAWLQVEAANGAALALYEALGFDEAYRYHYRMRQQ